jgi:TrmH family RNA methyltransferase
VRALSFLTSRDNPKVRHWTRLVSDARYRRSENRALIEGPHLLAAALEHGCRPLAVLATEKGTSDAEIRRLIGRSGIRPVLLPERLLRSIVDAETPQGVAAEVAIPTPDAKAGSATVFLEGVQDPTNVGAIVRTAAAFGAGRIVLDRGCADAWSARTLRAAAGGHFALQIASTVDLASELDAFRGTLVVTVPQGGSRLGETLLRSPLGWVFGAEGRGVSEPIAKRAKLRITIPMAPGTESLNVAATAAICLYAGFSRAGA